MSEHSAKLPKDGVIAGGLAQRLRDALAGCQPDPRRVRVEFVNDCAFEVDLTNTTPSETQQPEDSAPSVIDAKAFEAACKALAVSDLMSRTDPYTQEQAERVAEEKFDEWSDDAEACVRAYLGSVKQAEGSIQIRDLTTPIETLEDLRGVAPDATGDTNSEDFIAKQRSEEW